MKEGIGIIGYTTFIFIFGICVGLFSVQVYDYYNYQREYNGLWMRGNITKSEAEGFSYERDSGGDWICVNIRDMDFEDAFETCLHETGHEIFAEFCEKDAEKCFEVVEEIKNE